VPRGRRRIRQSRLSHKSRISTRAHALLCV
jgi:hypothetical protein